MQKEIVSSGDVTTTTNAIISGANLSQNLLPSPKSQVCEFDDNASFYYSMFQPYSNCFSISPSDCSYDDDVSTTIAATDDCLNQASFILEYQQLYNSYKMCLTSLQDSMNEVEALRLENERLRLSNSAIIQQLSMISQATIPNGPISSVNCPSRTSLIDDFRRLSVRDSTRAVGEASSVSPTSVIEQNRLERKRGDRIPMPKSISVRSTGYVKSSHGYRLPSHSLIESQRVHIPGAKTAKEALEFEVYNQGMTKTELCNKWQETGACPYGDKCQFAHGVSELRPVIRHPRYKTEVCRMVLAGHACPYGHRCHFRHSLTDQEMLMSNQR